MNTNDPAPTAGLSLPFTKKARANAHFKHDDLGLPFAHKVPDVWRNHFIACCGEFVGTVLFLYFALAGTQVANSIKSSAGLSVEETGANPQQLQYIALCFGFSLAVNAWVFFRISGGLFNPAVTVGMCLIGALPWVRGVLLFFVQILGGITAAALVSCMFPGPLAAQTTLGGGTSVAQGVFIEAFLTALLVFTIFMLAAEKHLSTHLAPVGIGLALFVAELTGVYFTGGSLNPARSFGPAVVAHTFPSYHWIYWVGPLFGSLMSAGFFKFIKMLEYETANPGQDAAAIAREALAAGSRPGTAATGDDTMHEKVGGPHGTTNGTHAPRPANVSGISSFNGAGAGATDMADRSTGFGAGVKPRPEPRRLSTRARMESPAMNTEHWFGTVEAARPVAPPRRGTAGQMV